MTRLSVHEVSGGPVTPAPQLRVLQISGDAQAPRQLRVLDVRGVARGDLRLRVHELVGGNAATLALQPFTVATVPAGRVGTAVAALADGGTAEAWYWEQTSGPTVTLAVNGPQARFVAPAIMPPGATITLLVRVTRGTATAEQTATFTVLPETEYTRVAGRSWVGASPVEALISA